MANTEHLDVGPLFTIVILLAAAVCVVAIFKRLNLSPVLGYLVAGALIGQNGFEYVDSDQLHLVAEFGVVFLLFAIGLELTFDRLISMRWHVFGFGSAQVLVTAVGIGVVCLLVGLNPSQSMVIGGALALSSTAIVMRMIVEYNIQNTQVGRLTFANLLLQDLAVVPLLTLVPILALQSSGENTDSMLFVLVMSIGKALLAMTAVFLVGKVVLRPLFHQIAATKSNELFISTTLLVVLGSSLVTEQMGLSLAMGAFIAGLLVAETQYQHQVEDHILPIKDLFMGLFFMTVGMGIDLGTIYEKLGLIVILSVLLILFKAVVIIGLARLFKFEWGSSLHTGLMLAQGGEFAFVLFDLASKDGGVLGTELAQLLLLVVTITMAVTPLLAKLGMLAHRRIDEQIESPTVDMRYQDIEDLNRHIIIAGFGRTGAMVARLLSAKKVSYIVLEADAKRAREARSAGFPVYHGDPCRSEILKSIGANRARAMIITIPDDVYLKKAIRTVSKHFPDLPIVVRSVDLRNFKALQRLGATIIVPEKYESGLQLAGALLATVGMSDFEISELKNQFRAGNYEQAQDSDLQKLMLNKPNLTDI